MSEPIENSFSLRGKVILQSGGSGVLGQALAASLAANGATLVVTSRDRKRTSTLLNSPGQPLIAVEEADPASEESMLALKDRVLENYGRIDGLVYNAVSRPMRSMADSISAWNTSMALNSTGLFITMRVVNIASMQGMVGSNPWLYEEGGTVPPPDYFFHKGGMINLTRYLASHYGPHGVRVNAVSPGGIRNPGNPQPPALLARYGKLTMLGRMAEAPEICGAVVFLLSDAASYITGANLPVDGGYTAK
jgi:NAD(P)-dependent dehydrogenase (short-subunit alcohol dehydrogenase family)